MLKKLLILTIAMTGLVACSDEQDQDTRDLQRHQSERTIFAGSPEVQVESRPEVIQTMMQSLFYINPKGSLTFVQGQSKKVYFDVRLSFADLDGLRYNIKMAEGPSDLGARFGVDSNGYYLQWSPKLGIINNQENSKDFKIKLIFGLDPSSSLSNKRELSGQDVEREYWVTLLKNRTQPIITNVKYSSADQTLNPNSVGKINFTVSVKGAHKKEDILVGIVPASKDTDTPARELVQVSGLPALIEAPKLTSVQSPSPGTVNYNYQLSFDANLMIDHAIRKIEADPVLKNRMATNRINTAEGIFSIEAINDDNGERSQQKKLMYKVNLTPEVGDAVLTGFESMSFKQGLGYGINFQLRSAGKKGSISETHEIPEVEGVQIALNCNPRSKMSNREEGCFGGVCILDCRMTAESTCDAKPGLIEVPVTAKTALYEEEKESTFKIKVRVTANNKYCTGGPS